MLETVSGMNIRNSGGIGSYAEATIRGGSSNVEIILDGVPLNRASEGSVDLGKIPLSTIQSVTIYKNVSSLELGGSSDGGIIELTSDPKKDLISACSEIGSYGTGKINAVIRKKSRTIVHRLSFDITHSDNNYSYIDDNGTTIPTVRNPDPNYDDTVRQKRNNYFTDINASYSVSLHLKNHRIISRVSFDNNKEGMFVYRLRQDQSGSSGNQSFSFFEKYDSPQENRLNLTASVSGLFKNSFLEDPDGHFGTGNLPKSIHSNSPSVITNITGKYKANEFLSTALRVSGGFESTTNTDLLYKDALRPQIQRAHAICGGELSYDSRYIKIRTTYLHRFEIDSTKNLTTVGAAQIINKHDYIQYPDLEGNLQLRLSDKFSVFSDAVYLSRSPTFFELYGWGNMYMSNPELRPEERHEIDAGISLSLRRLSSSVSVFTGKVLGKIKIIPVSQYYHAMNFDDIRYTGLEWDTKFSLPFHLSITHNLTLLDSRFCGSLYADRNGKYEPFIPKFRDHLETAYEGKFLEFGHDFLFESAYYLNPENTLKSPENLPFLNAWISLHIINHFEIRYRIENYLDIKSYDYNDFPKPGRMHFLSASINF